MKLKDHDESLDEKMSEFDIWVTPSLGEIRDMPQFVNNLDTMQQGFDIMAIITDDFSSIEKCSSSNIAKNTITLIANKEKKNIVEILNSIYGVLLLVTGKTDNNLKCQFPLQLRNVYNIESYPFQNQNGRWTKKLLPRTIKSDLVSNIIMHAGENQDFQEKFLESYIHLIISDSQYAKQLWSLGNSYCSQKN